MDSDNLVLTEELATAHQNGVHEQHPAAREDCVISDNVNGTTEKTTEPAGPNENLEYAFKLDDCIANNSSVGDVWEGSSGHLGSNGLTVSKVGGFPICLFGTGGISKPDFKHDVSVI